MDWLIFKTNIETQNQVQSLSLVLNTHSDWKSWTIDLDDVDKVLRVPSSPNFQEIQVINLLQSHGFEVEGLK